MEHRERLVWSTCLRIEMNTGVSRRRIQCQLVTVFLGC